MYTHIIGQMRKGLDQLETWLVKAAAHAQAKRFDADVLLGMRLAPDQFPFVRQVQTTCDTVKLAVARLTGREAPAHADTETSMTQLHTRIQAVKAWLDGIEPAAFDGAGERVITTPRWEGKSMTGADYFVEHAIPNFFFHLTTAYAILRHAGVDVGKRDFLGPLSLRS